MFVANFMLVICINSTIMVYVTIEFIINDIVIFNATILLLINEVDGIRIDDGFIAYCSQVSCRIVVGVGYCN